MRLDRDEIVEMMEQLKKEEVIRVHPSRNLRRGCCRYRIEPQTFRKGRKEVHPEGGK